MKKRKKEILYMCGVVYRSLMEYQEHGIDEDLIYIIKKDLLHNFI